MTPSLLVQAFMITQPSSLSSTPSSWHVIGSETKRNHWYLLPSFPWTHGHSPHYILLRTVDAGAHLTTYSRFMEHSVSKVARKRRSVSVCTLPGQNTPWPMCKSSSFVRDGCTWPTCQAIYVKVQSKWTGGFSGEERGISVEAGGQCGISQFSLSKRICRTNRHC